MLRVNQLLCGRDEPLFKPISFELKSGEALFITGVNGIGKTTLLRVLAGLLPAISGQMHWNEQLLNTTLSDYQQQLAYLGPHNGVKTALTPIENIRYFIPQDIHEDALQTTLNTLSLTPLQQQLCGGLSSGQKQRVALARIVLSRTKVWILDEPATALDKPGEQVLAALLDKHLAGGSMAVIASHHALSEWPQMQKINLEPY